MGFKDDPVEYAKEKYEFCKAHKVDPKNLYIPKKLGKLKFGLQRKSKHLRRDLKVKTKVCMTFLSDDEKRP